ncbi:MULTISPECIES: hypothetical protein [Streptomyces]|uniref:hypothetical protein n=1 Tax=Streptomyces lycopersici TaxID=2974589 RepID=UPI0021D07D5B|nr:hypothetical protein [Streptomyces sp. NEAU-383]
MTAVPRDQRTAGHGRPGTSWRAMTAARAPAGGDLVDGVVARCRVCEVAAGALQAPGNGSGGDGGGAFFPEEAVQVAEGNVVRGGYRARRELRIGHVLLDESTTMFPSRGPSEG